MRAILLKYPYLTVEELKEKFEIDCSIQAIHYALFGIGMSYKKDSQSLLTRQRRH